MIHEDIQYKEVNISVPVYAVIYLLLLETSTGYQSQYTPKILNDKTFGIGHGHRDLRTSSARICAGQRRSKICHIQPKRL